MVSKPHSPGNGDPLFQRAIRGLRPLLRGTEAPAPGAGSWVPVSSLPALVVLLAACGPLFPGPPGTPSLSAQEPPAAADTVPADTFQDEAARELVLRAREARQREVDGIESYEGLLRERVYVGLTALRFRRERGLFEQERVARIRWTDRGERAVQWLGARRAIPIVGADTRVGEAAESGRGDQSAEVREELREELPAELLSDVELPSFAFDPGGGDRLAFGEDWALHPLADTAFAHYRYRSGDTLRLGLPDRTLVLHEVRVEPRRADFHLVAASLWFEAESAALVRATYRPARAFDLGLDEPEEAEDVPGFLKPVQAEIRFIAVEYSLHELRYWLPRRFALEGEARLGGLVRMPLAVEWTMRDYQVNEATRMPMAGPLPPGWSRREERVEEPDGAVRYVTVIVPDSDSLMASATLSERLGPRADAAFSPDEIRDLRDELEGLLPTYSPYRPDLAWGLERGLLRYNRVEGLSVGVAGEAPLSPRTTLSATVRIGTGNQEPYGTLALRHGPAERLWEVEGYHQLESMNDWDDPFSLPGSFLNLLLGTDRGEYYEASGVTLAFTADGRTTRARVAAFAERHRPVALSSDFYLLDGLGLRDDTVRSVLAADPTDVVGVRGRLDWFRGLDPDGLILTGHLRGEVGRGGADYQRVAARLSASHPLFLGLAGAMEVASGAAWGAELPVQRQYFFGGTERIRGFDSNQFLGEAFWQARAEVGSDFPGARLVLFGDAGWIGDRARFSTDGFDSEEILLSVGVGASLLDGLLRLDVARALQGGSRWKVHGYFDGLF